MRSTGARVGLLVVLVAAAVVLFVVLSGGDDDDGGGSTSATTETTSTGGSESTPAPQPEMLVITVKDDQAVGGVQSLDVSKGDQVRFQVKSVNVADEVHVHGYDLSEEVEPGGTVTFSFAADIDGVFEAELEGAHQQILELRVNP
jgi:hypothetical protein